MTLKCRGRIFPVETSVTLRVRLLFLFVLINLRCCGLVVNPCAAAISVIKHVSFGCQRWFFVVKFPSFIEAINCKYQTVYVV